MNSDFFGGLFSIAIALVGLATLAVLVSRQANTVNILTAGAGGFAKDIQAATNPFSGSGFGFGNEHYGPGY